MIALLVHKKKRFTYREKVATISGPLSMDPPRMTGMPKWGPYVFLAAMSFVFLQEYIYSTGRADASGIQEFLVYTDTPSCLVVREYSDHLICAEYDSVQVLPVFRLIPLKDKPIKLTWEKTGNLKGMPGRGDRWK